MHNRKKMYKFYVSFPRSTKYIDGKLNYPSSRSLGFDLFEETDDAQNGQNLIDIRRIYVTRHKASKIRKRLTLMKTRMKSPMKTIAEMGFSDS